MALTLRQLLFALAFGLLINLALRWIPISNWYAAIGCLAGIWLGRERAGATQLARLFMLLYVRLRSRLSTPRIVDISAEWQLFTQENDSI